jgi:hypothetical protein
MMKCDIEIRGNQISCELGGNGNESEMLLFVGILEDLKFKLLNAKAKTGEDGIIFMQKDGGKKDEM